MTLSQTTPPPVDVDEGIPQWSLARILGVWAVVTVPMGLLAFVVTPWAIPRVDLHPGLVFWLAMVVGMAWQLVVATVLLAAEGGLSRASLARRIRANGPRDPRTGRPRRRLWWWAVAAIGVNAVGGLLAGPLDVAWVRAIPAVTPAWYTDVAVLADRQFAGQWWILGVAVVSSVLNYVLGEELVFRGLLLPRMRGAFGRWDWVANTVLFGLYHVHRVGTMPSVLLSSFGISWAAARYRSFWMGVVVHGIEGFFVVLVLAVVAGWYPS
ncbi:CPBP family intramembrane metalloprotease [Phycicoccus sp. HDW14]|uniref:CPBP family intramembrane glutamic endopeptidase n=1 Tax=Phycicoccus sp. HDW14 TaxID=2714941 RepID=UPI001408831A|nr:CPBP family intramembrane glutamic endopeptidase [Phycicoccus sp. HDW14]QIM20026.1 CPBP family intramembrane metalloprotease [Phycicoccus sp. HDW14]